MSAEKIDRNGRIFEAAILGSTLASAGKAEGVTAGRVRQVVHKMRRMMMHPQRIGTDAVPDYDYWKTKELRAHADFWLGQLLKWLAEHGFNVLLTGATMGASG